MLLLEEAVKEQEPLAYVYLGDIFLKSTHLNTKRARSLFNDLLKQDGINIFDLTGALWGLHQTSQTEKNTNESYFWLAVIEKTITKHLEKESVDEDVRFTLTNQLNLIKEDISSVEGRLDPKEIKPLHAAAISCTNSSYTNCKH